MEVETKVEMDIPCTCPECGYSWDKSCIIPVVVNVEPEYYYSDLD